MSDISILEYNGTEYLLKDSSARTSIAELEDTKIDAAAVPPIITDMFLDALPLCPVSMTTDQWEIGQISTSGYLPPASVDGFMTTRLRTPNFLDADIQVITVTPPYKFTICVWGYDLAQEKYQWLGYWTPTNDFIKEASGGSWERPCILQHCPKLEGYFPQYRFRLMLWSDGVSFTTDNTDATQVQLSDAIQNIRLFNYTDTNLQDIGAFSDAYATHQALHEHVHAQLISLHEPTVSNPEWSNEFFTNTYTTNQQLVASGAKIDIAQWVTSINDPYWNVTVLAPATGIRDARAAYAAAYKERIPVSVLQKISMENSKYGFGIGCYAADNSWLGYLWEDQITKTYRLKNTSGIGSNISWYGLWDTLDALQPRKPILTFDEKLLAFFAAPIFVDGSASAKAVESICIILRRAATSYIPPFYYQQLPEAIQDIKIYLATDTSLTHSGIAADAASVGDIVRNIITVNNEDLIITIPTNN